MEVMCALILMYWEEGGGGEVLCSTYFGRSSFHLCSITCRDVYEELK